MERFSYDAYPESPEYDDEPVVVKCLSEATKAAIEEIKAKPVRIVTLCAPQPSLVKEPEEIYKLVVYNTREQKVFAAGVTASVLRVLPHFATLMDISMKERQERVITLRLPNVTKDACIYYLRYLQWRKNGCPLPYPSCLMERADPSTLILAHYLDDTFFLHGFVVIDESNNLLKWCEEQVLSVEPVTRWGYNKRLSFMLTMILPNGVYSAEALCELIQQRMNQESEFDYTYTVSYNDGRISVTTSRETDRFYGFEGRNWERAGVFQLTQLWSHCTFAVNADFPQGYPDGTAEVLVEHFITSLVMKPVPWYVRLRELSLNEPIAALIMRNQSGELAKWFRVPSTSQMKVASLASRPIHELREYAEAMIKRHNYEEVTGPQPWQNDVEVRRIYGRIKALTHLVSLGVRGSAYERDSVHVSDIFTAIETEHEKLQQRVSFLTSRQSKPTQRRDPYNAAYYM